MPIAPDRLIQWIIQECEQRNWTWNEASIRAGLSRNSISAIIRGTQPGLKTCVALARVFNCPPEYVLQLAGHLPKTRAESNRSPQETEIEYRLHHLGHAIREQYLPIISAVLDAAEIAEGETEKEEEK